MKLIAVLLLALAACGGADPLVEAGQSLASDKGCASCHSVDGSKGVGPTWKGLYLTNVELEGAGPVLADRAYLRESMLQPSAKTVAGFKHGLMEQLIPANSLSDDEVKALIAYIESLR
ncbi:MAG: cytochrome c [Actinomycetota bacterium]